MTSETFFATIRHNSISRARTIKVVGDLAAAKRKAAAEFRGEQNDYMIVIYQDTPRGPETVATRKVGSARWADQI